MIRITGLNKFYNKNKSNEIHVINDVNLELPSHGFVSFLGASGSGKTTLLNVIGGLDKATGSIAYDSFEMHKYDMASIDRFRNENFGYVFQSYNLLLGETVYDNLRIALDLIDIRDPDEVTCRIEYALKSVGMYKYRKKRASQLSGGQQQRVAIARALVKHCKVIIADEPTGNLDSANAVEVMNILKSISKKTLVLLVTHNESLARFYSDFIYRIEDGRIVDRQENVGDASLDAQHDNVIYLRDMTLRETESDSVRVKLYSEGDSTVELEIVERNNTFYLRSNRNIKLLENSNIKLVDGHYKPTEKAESLEYQYDDSFFNNTKSKRHTARDVLSALYRSLRSFRPTKKMKALRTSLALIGVLFAWCAISVANAQKIDTSEIYSDNAYSSLYSSDYNYGVYDDGDLLKEGLQNGEVSSIQLLYYRYIYFTKQLNFVEEESYDRSNYQIYYNDRVNTVLYGRAPVGSEIAISKGIADEMLESFGEYVDSYEDLFDLIAEDGRTKLVGIVDNPGIITYVSEEEYINNTLSWIYTEENYYRYYDFEKKYNTYEIVAGRDLDESDKGTGNVLISEDRYRADELLGKQVAEGIVVGIYRLRDVNGSPDDVIANLTPSDTSTYGYKEGCRYSYGVEDYVIVEGREPERDNECLVSMYSSFNVGDKFDGYTIVGRYNASATLLNAGVLLSTSALSFNVYAEKAFILENEDAFLERVDGEFEVKGMYDAKCDELEDNNKRARTVYSVLGIISLIAASVLVMFLMRSRMLSDIYNIGVYRSLGSSKRKIYAKHLCDIFVMVTFTTLIAYLIVMIIYFTAIGSLNDYLGTELFSRSIIMPLIGTVIIYAVNLIFGLLPIFTLLRRTPSEILAKYDI